MNILLVGSRGSHASVKTFRASCRTAETALGTMGRSEKITGEKSGAVEPARRKAALKPVHPARPAEGDVDYAALRSDVKAKFPKTIARLAK